MKVEYISFNQCRAITDEQLEEIASIDISEKKPAVILTLDDGQKIFITTADWATIYKYKGE